MTRTPTLPLDDRGMWRRLVRRTHPDAGGDHELFIWTVVVRDAICSGVFGGEVPRSERRERPSRRRETPTSSAADRVPFDQLADFGVLTDRALAMAEAEAVVESYGYLLRQVADCYPAEDGPLRDQQCRGATYKTLAAIGHQVGMSKAERVQWYRIAEAIPLSQRHAGHVLSRLKRRAA
jgi:hypothetical protein